MSQGDREQPQATGSETRWTLSSVKKVKVESEVQSWSCDHHLRGRDSSALFLVCPLCLTSPQSSTVAAEAPAFISTFHQCGTEKPPSHLACPQPPPSLGTSHGSLYPEKGKVILLTTARRKERPCVAPDPSTRGRGPGQCLSKVHREREDNSHSIRIIMRKPGRSTKAGRAREM